MKINWENINIENLAAIICEFLEKNNIKTTLVGGACVSIYTKNKYLSSDLDFVTESSIRELIPIFNQIGFKRKSGRHFENPRCNFFIEFPAPPLSIGNEPVTKFNFIKTKYGTIRLLTPTDCVKDRLAAYFFWNDPQSLEQAILVTKNNEIDLINIKKWALKENKIDKFNVFLGKVKKSRNFVIPKKYIDYIEGKELKEKDKKMIDMAVKKTVQEYGEVLKLLGRE